ncbi:hypothetical protein BGT96224_3591B [Blumeria graminis f. sp. tritici 96224]|uniref:Bgt-3591-2 n=1 Tax=Blumeria graminis f. sp. tritici 96224 TaxID=1268274 RepID=A0A381LCJ4_BLUGR|nr:hypothetical protein BGT96224_3591B [Blumeria graminis f. sp. tritici 96224]
MPFLVCRISKETLSNFYFTLSQYTNSALAFPFFQQPFAWLSTGSTVICSWDIYEKKLLK